VTPPAVPAERFRRRVVGLYALSLMEREGSTHGYRLSEAISERTRGTWRPGPGAVYPSLQKLVDAKLARRKAEGRRQVYSITPSGSALLRRMRSRSKEGWGDRRDLSRLWAEVLGVSDVGELHRLRLRRSIDSVEEHLASGDSSPADSARLRREVAEELRASLARIERLPVPSTSRPTPRARAPRTR
jgi:DNA-binding PadR family transcriptional regulator